MLVFLFLSFSFLFEEGRSAAGESAAAAADGSVGWMAAVRKDEPTTDVERSDDFFIRTTSRPSTCQSNGIFQEEPPTSDDGENIH